MPSDERLALMKVLTGGWYECPKGHTYYVSECGRPTQGKRRTRKEKWDQGKKRKKMKG